MPAVAAAELVFERGERVLSVGHGPEGGCALVATDRALYCRAGGDGWSRLGWEEIARVEWDAAAGRLVVIGLTGVPFRTVVPLQRRGTVPELVAERVAHSRLGRWDLLVAGARRVPVEARRRPATEEVLWVVLVRRLRHGRDTGGDRPAGRGPRGHSAAPDGYRAASSRW